MIAEDVNIKIENNIVEAVQNYDIKVDREELAKALAYDRDQYSKGFAAARKEYERPQGKWIKQYGKSYELKTKEGVLVGEFTKCPKCQYDKARGSNFCPNCGASMKKGGGT